MNVDTFWILLMNAVAVPLGVLDYAIYGLAALLTGLANLIGDTRQQWIVWVRVWSGRTRDGRTRAMLAEEHNERERVLAELREAQRLSSPATPP